MRVLLRRRGGGGSVGGGAVSQTGGRGGVGSLELLQLLQVLVPEGQQLLVALFHRTLLLGFNNTHTSTHNNSAQPATSKARGRVFASNCEMWRDRRQPYLLSYARVPADVVRHPQF